MIRQSDDREDPDTAVVAGGRRGKDDRKQYMYFSMEFYIWFPIHTFNVYVRTSVASLSSWHLIFSLNVYE